MKKIFLHEPNAAIFDVMTIALNDLGYTVSAFPGEDANIESELIHYDPDLVIIDCFYDLLKPALWNKQVKSLISGVCTIASSCNNDIDKTYKLMGFDAYLKKPFEMDFLSQLVLRYTRQFASCS